MKTSKLRILLPAALFFLLLCSSSSALAMAGKPPVVLPEGVLSSEQIKGLFSGKTVAAVVDGKNDDSVRFFAVDGKLTQVSRGWQEPGSWDVREDGRLCVDLPSTGRDCRIILKEGDVYRQYVVKNDGDHRYELTYTAFQKGNQLVEMSPDPLLPDGTLTGDEVVELFSGKTVESVTAGKGRVSQTYYDPDGALVQLQEGVQRLGQWRVTKDARICLQMEGFEEKCRIIVREGSEIKKYIVKKNGQHQHSVSYQNFLPGKRF